MSGREVYFLLTFMKKLFLENKIRCLSVYKFLDTFKKPDFFYKLVRIRTGTVIFDFCRAVLGVRGLIIK